MKRAKRVLLCVLLVLASTLVAIVVLLVSENVLEFAGVCGLRFIVDPLAYSDTDFDSQSWRDSRDPWQRVSPSPRYSMAKSLVQDHLQPGAHRAAVRELLGPPDHAHSVRAPCSRAQPYWDYELGRPLPGMRGYDRTLHIWFDNEGRYVDFSVSVDT